MENIGTEFNFNRRWYNNENFPLIPFIRIRKADQYNTRSFYFSWLFIKFWTLDSFSFEFSFVISEHWGIAFPIIIPYLRIVIGIPFPSKFSYWIQRNLWRKPKQIIKYK